jgi:hypothetical protein
MADEKAEIYFTKRITRISGVLVITIPSEEKEFEHKDLVKITLLRKADKNDEDDEGNNEDKNNPKQKNN